MGEFSDLIPEFVEESLEHLKNIEEDIIIIEQGTADNDLINRVFRAVHSIKGGSSFLGLKNIEQLSHKMEDIFNLVRNNDLDFTSHISSCVLKSIDKLKEMLESTEDSDNYDIRSNLKELKQCLDQQGGGSEAETVKVGKRQTALKVDKYTIDSLKKQGKNIFHIQFELIEGEHEGIRNPLDFFREIEKTGEILEQEVDMELVMKGDRFTGEGIPLSVAYATVLEKDLVAHMFKINERNIQEVTSAPGVEEDIAPLKKEPVAAPSPNRMKLAEETPLVEEIEEEEEFEEDLDIVKDKNEYLTFLVGDEEYGIGITQVHEIVTMQEITRLPQSENFIKGIINLRGDIIPVFDFRLKLHFEERDYDSETIILIVMIHEKRAGIIVDRVSEVIQLNRKEVVEAPQMQQIPSEYVIGIGQKDDKFIILLKVSAIFRVGEDAPL